MKVPFSPPRIDEHIAQSVREALFSGWITTGPRTKQFEKDITAYTGAKATVCLNSATAGLELMLNWFGIGVGDEVIVPAYTYCATGNVVLHCGARLVLVDADDDFNISIEAVRRAITSKTKVIIPVDIGGLPCDYDALMELVETHRQDFTPTNDRQRMLGRILVMADAAHSVGARYKGRKSGVLADVSCFSFHAVKNLTTAEGGAISLNLPKPFDNEEVYHTLCIKSLHGQTKDALAKTQLGSWRYDIVEPGFKCNMTDIQAAIGLVELNRYETETLPRRRSIFEFYTHAFGNSNRFVTPTYESRDRISSYHVYMLRIKDISEEQRDEIIRQIGMQDVAVNVHFQPLPLFTAYKERGYSINEFPKAYSLYCGEISLPVWFDISEQQLQKVVFAVKKSVAEVLI